MRRLLTISFLLLSMAGFSQQAASSDERSRTIDSITARLQENLHDTDRVQPLNKLAFQLMYTNPDTAIFLSSQALSLSEAHKWQIGIANSVSKLATFHWVKGDYSKAVEYYLRNLKMSEELLARSSGSVVLSIKNARAANFANISLVYMDQGDYPHALEYSFKALRIDEELGNKKGIAYDYGNIGTLYDELGDHSNALKYYFKSLKLSEELGDKNIRANNLSNIGLVYAMRGGHSKAHPRVRDSLYDRALEYYFNALEINEELGNTNGIALNLGNIGGVYQFQDEFPKALEFYVKALKMNEEMGIKIGIAVNLGNIGSLYTKTGEFVKAEESLQKAVGLSMEIGTVEYSRDHHKFLSDLYDTIGKPALAFEAYKQYIVYRDSISNQENTKALTQTEMQYEYEKQELVREQQEKEKTRIEAEVTGRRDNLQYSVILIALLVLFGGVLSLGFVKVSVRMAEGIIFFSFLILFEFLLVLADPYIDNWSGGAPGIKLLFNAGIAALIFPLHSLFEMKLKGKLIR